MCEICQSEGRDAKYMNGDKPTQMHAKLYRVFKDKVAPIRICHVHNIELFSFGETSFIRRHINFAYYLSKRGTRIV